MNIEKSTELEKKKDRCVKLFDTSSSVSAHLLNRSFH